MDRCRPLGDLMKKLILLALCAFYNMPANAMYFNSIIYDMDASKDFISRPVINDTNKTNLYTLSAYKISRPGNGLELAENDITKDLIWSPLKLTIQPNGREYFKLYYRGPKDDVERYYRVVFRETPVTLFPWRAERKKIDVIPSVSMSTILIVRPRNAHLSYEIDEQNGIIKNTGNTYFRVILQQGCDGNDESSTQFYMLPGEIWKGTEALSNNKKYIVALGKYHHLGNGCFTTL